MSAPFAFLFSLPSSLELVIILVVALMIFGGNLPEVAMRAAAHVMRARRAVSRMWRETGLEEELRRVQRDIENAVPRDVDFDLKPKNAARIDDPRAAARRARDAAAQAEDARLATDSVDPDADRAEPVHIEPHEELIADGDFVPEGDAEGDAVVDGAANPSTGGDADTGSSSSDSTRTA